MYFLIISDVLPSNEKTGGEIVLYRHLVERKFMDFKIIKSEEIKPIKKWKSKIIVFLT